MKDPKFPGITGPVKLAVCVCVCGWGE